MNTNDISILLKKADELRSLFVLGQRVIPFLEEIFVFVQDIQPMLEEINQSIDENIQKMPGASEKLSKVTEANELATTEIMDTLDKMFGSTDKLHKNSATISEHYEKIIDKPLRLLEILRRGIVSGGDLNKAIPQIDNAIAKIKSFSSKKIKPIEDENKSIIDEINNDAGAIMMSLQVQDITSQQIAAVDHMLSTIQDKLAQILKHFKNTDVSSLVDIDEKESDDPLKTNTKKLHREIAFDPNAINSYDDNQKRQEEIDELIKSGEIESEEDYYEKEESTEELSEDESDLENINEPQNQDDIDAMFTGSFEQDDLSEDEELSESINDDTISDEQKEETKEEEEPQADEEELNTLQDQDDIDAMFTSLKDNDDELNENSETEEGLQDSDSEKENQDEEQDFDISKFDELGDNPDPNDIDALFNRS